MNFILNQPGTFSEQGQKSNQEDRIAPSRTAMTPSTRCFVLCDGMGGHENGEVAAEIVSQSLYQALTSAATVPDRMSDDRFKEALAKAYAALDKMPVGEGKRPGTTMTCLYFAENGVLAAHIGDSRIYQIRPGQGIIFKTRDHSLVNDLIRAGELTEEEAVNYPHKNVITRAMQPGLDRPYRADITMLTDVRPGDYFFMCSDGILEQLSDKRLTEIVEEKNTVSDKIQEIFDVCFNKTRDNFTCILIPVDKVEGQAPVIETATKIVPTQQPAGTVARKGSSWKNSYLVFALIFLAVATLCVLLMTGGDDEPENADNEKEQAVTPKEEPSDVPALLPEQEAQSKTDEEVTETNGTLEDDVLDEIDDGDDKKTEQKKEKKKAEVEASELVTGAIGKFKTSVSGKDKDDDD